MKSAIQNVVWVIGGAAKVFCVGFGIGSVLLIFALGLAIPVALFMGFLQ